MFYGLREFFARATIKARQLKKGVWSKDKTNIYTTIGSLGDITDTHVLLPKLFRRITAYIKTHGAFDAADFITKLEGRPEKVIILSILHFTFFDNFLSVSDSGKIKPLQKPENIVFLS